MGGAHTVQSVPKWSENEKNEVTVFTDHTKLFRAVNARLIVRTAEGHYKSEWWDDEVVSEIHCRETWSSIHGKNKPNFTHKMLSSKVIATLQEWALSFLIACCVKTSSWCLLLITLTQWKWRIIREGVKIKTESSMLPSHKLMLCLRPKCVFTSGPLRSKGIQLTEKYKEGQG